MVGGAFPIESYFAQKIGRSYAWHGIIWRPGDPYRRYLRRSFFEISTGTQDCSGGAKSRAKEGEAAAGLFPYLWSGPFFMSFRIFFVVVLPGVKPSFAFSY